MASWAENTLVSTAFLTMPKVLVELDNSIVYHEWYLTKFSKSPLAVIASSDMASKIEYHRSRD